MLISKLVGERTKNAPSDATIASHSLLMRAGFIKLVSNGIWTLSMPARRITHKIEDIIRQEMDRIEGQEVTFPVVMPRELWEESGRYKSIGDELVRFKDRAGRDMLLGMTHEEAAVHFARDSINSYQQLPCMVYQLQTKFRDEARSRGGLIRVREFIMKDAYSFHTTEEDLITYYDRMYDAYNRIFTRIGMKDFIAVKSDTGMMGGSVAHEYMLLTEIGEDTLVICPHCGYKANMEVGEGKFDYFIDKESSAMQEIFTGEAKDIDAVCKMLKIEAHHTIKSVVYNVKGEQTLVVAFVRGDLEVNEAKLKRAIKKDIVPANLKDSEELCAGNIGAIGLNLKDAIIVYDNSLINANNMIGGANKPLYHINGIDMARDIPNAKFYDINKITEGMLCSQCNQPLTIRNGIEIGNIFQLGTKYTKAMNMQVLGSDGKTFNPIMGCYGIGVGRALASVAEESHDEKGLIWPMAIAPWQVYLCALRLDDAKVKENAYKLYKEMEDNGIEVLFDDRDVSPGCKFSDCDLMGIPIRIVISPRSLANNQVEIQMRDGSYKDNIELSQIIEVAKNIIKK